MGKSIKVIGIYNRPETDGSHLVELELPDGSVVHGIIPLKAAHAIVSVLTPEIHVDAGRNAQTMDLPAAEICRLSVVHARPTAELLIGTKEIPAFVLQMSDEWLAELQKSLEKVRSSRQSSKTVR